MNNINFDELDNFIISTIYISNELNNKITSVRFKNDNQLNPNILIDSEKSLPTYIKVGNTLPTLTMYTLGEETLETKIENQFVSKEELQEAAKRKEDIEKKKVMEPSVDLNSQSVGR